jgi:tRNA (mo5U34)-methyltransferase
MDLNEILKECPEWFHSIDLGSGLVTPGRKNKAVLDGELEGLRLPDLRGKSVLDVGAYDGFFSFACEERGAARVVALDQYVWSVDMAAYMEDWRASKRTGAPLPAPVESRHYHPDTLPGKKPFDLAHRLRKSKVEPIVGDLMTMDLAPLGKFDVVLYLGVLYHMEEPLTSMRRLRSVIAPGGVAVIETEAVEVPGLDRAYCEFFPGQELNNDASNWWAPNAKALEGLGRAAGFRETIVFNNPPPVVAEGRRLLSSLLKGAVSGHFELPVTRFRAYAHAHA